MSTDVSCRSMCTLATLASPNHSNEDFLVDTELQELQGARLVCVVDGHGGDFVSKLVADRLPHHILRCALESDLSVQQVSRSLVKAFRATEEEVQAAAAKADNTSGACAAIALVYQGHVLTANVGDCRVLACLRVDEQESLQGRQLTVDHRARLKKERARIIQAGGWISKKEQRVFGVLSPSRSFGDADLKTSPPRDPTPKPKNKGKNKKRARGPVDGHAVISCTPACNTLNIATSGLVYLVVASDGLWDACSNKKVIKKLNETPDTHPSDLCSLARSEENTDDISIAIVKFIV